MSNPRDYAALPYEYIDEMAALDDAEFGRLVRALLLYSRDGTPIEPDGNARFYAARVMGREDRYQKAFRESKARMSRHAKRAAAARWTNNDEPGPGMPEDARGCPSMPKDARACPSMPEDARGCPSMPEHARDANTNTDTETDTKAESESESETNSKTESVTGEENTRPRPHGTYGWVMLTQEQYEALVRELGEAETERCIAYVDESAQSTGNRNQWRDWALVVRRCSRNGWGRNLTRFEQRKAEEERDRAQVPKVSIEELEQILERI